MQYTDGKNIYFVHGVLGDSNFAVCVKKIGSDSIGVHKYRSTANKVVKSEGEAQDYLDQLAIKKGWDEYEQKSKGYND